MPKDTDELSIKELLEKVNDWWSYLISKWRIIILVGIIGGILGLLISFLKKPTYTATLSFVLEDDGSSGSGLGGAMGLASQFGFDLGSGGGGIFTGDNLMELFKSRRMVEETLLSPVNVLEGKKISLAEMYIDDQGWRQNWIEDSKLKNIKFLPKMKREIFTREHDSILGKMYEIFSMSDFAVEQPDKKVSIINIQMTSKNEVFSKVFIESLVKVVSEFYVDTKSKKARLNMIILEKQVDSVRNELNSALTGVAMANDNTFNLNPALNVRRVPSAKRQVDVQANSTLLAELVKQTELAKVSLRRDTPLIQVIDAPVYPLKKNEFGKIKSIFIGSFLSILFLILFYILRKEYQ
ncbi:Wzz/FepE/Etk N-terminal domain-containing protein [Flavobacterium aquicola]|nr:Wzz/FepE/Etk N-terminal domain-containing protein [Flavobacterium aquicola]